ncbi:MAG: hypothetical protein DRP85_06635 [Candidatus Makaraimicrobium thalassicum]|nr:MAG: hypothetical protein DRP85_06635 [Candidatus Omnitrophota bacterium]
MKMKYFGLFAAIFGVLVLVASIKAATPGSVISASTTNLGEYTPPTPQAITTESGNITNANLTAIQSTYRWAGIFGTITGTIVLADASNNYFYNWTGAKGVYVYASEGTSINWTGLDNATVSDVIGQYTWLSGAEYADNYTNTFNETCNFNSNALGKSFIAACAKPLSSGSTTWNVTVLKDTPSPSARDDIIWTAEVVEDGTGYNGWTVDYELLVPENGVNGDTTTEDFYLWVELE